MQTLKDKIEEMQQAIRAREQGIKVAQGELTERLAERQDCDHVFLPAIPGFEQEGGMCSRCGINQVYAETYRIGAKYTTLPALESSRPTKEDYLETASEILGRSTRSKLSSKAHHENDVEEPHRTAEMQRRVTELENALRLLINKAESLVCCHENRHRGGAIWEICDDCGRAWADDRGGFKKHTEWKELTAARTALNGHAVEYIPKI